MLARLILVVLLVGACYAPDPQPGAPCSAAGACPRPLTCSAGGTCERTPFDAQTVADQAIDTGCVPSGPEICGNGIDDDCVNGDISCVANDLPGGAIDVTAGGTFTADLLRATDDLEERGCTGFGGREVFYSVELTSPRVYYFDTFGSTFDSVLRVFAGRSCGNLMTGMPNPRCVDDSCGTPASQAAVSLPAGDSCVVIDDRGDPAPSLVLHVIAAQRDGVVMTGTSYSSTTCGQPSISGATCATTNQAGEVAHAITVCPGNHKLDADTCAAGADNILYVQSASAAEIACNDDNTTCSDNLRAAVRDVPVSGPAMYWVIVDGFGVAPGDTCGAYTLTTAMQ